MRKYFGKLMMAVCLTASLMLTAGCSSSQADVSPEGTTQQVAVVDDVNPVVSQEEDCVDTIEDIIEVEGDDILIPDETVPLGPGTDTKTTTKTDTKTQTKQKKKKKPSKVSKTVTKKKTKKETSSSVTSTASVVEVTTTVTTQSTRYEKGSRILSITTKIDTTIQTSTTPIEQGEMDIHSVAKYADGVLLQSFSDQGYKYVVDTGCSSTGLFSSRNKQITLRYQSDVIYHELGHFLAYTTGKQDLTGEFASIYAAEKNNYTGDNKAYVIQNAAEYFAESYRDYVTRNNTLRAQRPQTCAYIQKVLAML